MSLDWKRILGFLLRILIVFIFIVPISLWFSVDPKYILISVIALTALWTKRAKLVSTLNRAKIIVIIVYGAFVFFGFISWWVRGDSNIFATVVIGGAVIVLLTFAFND